MEDGQIELVTGQKIDISMTQVEGNNDAFSVSYDKLIEDVEVRFCHSYWMMVLSN